MHTQRQNRSHVPVQAPAVDPPPPSSSFRVFENCLEIPKKLVVWTKCWAIRSPHSCDPVQSAASQQRGRNEGNFAGIRLSEVRAVDSETESIEEWSPCIYLGSRQTFQVALDEGSRRSAARVLVRETERQTLTRYPADEVWRFCIAVTSSSVTEVSRVSWWWWVASWDAWAVNEAADKAGHSCWIFFRRSIL